MSDPWRDPWARQWHEGTQAYHAFEHYRDLGNGRTLRLAIQDHNTKCRGMAPGLPKAAHGRWNEWSQSHGWGERVRAWDMHLADQRIRAEERSVRMFQRRKVAFALRMQDKILKSLEMMDPAELTPAILAKWLEVSVRIEAEGRGLIVEGASAPSRAGAGTTGASQTTTTPFGDLDEPIITDAERRASLDLAADEYVGFSTPTNGTADQRALPDRNGTAGQDREEDHANGR